MIVRGWDKFLLLAVHAPTEATKKLSQSRCILFILAYLYLPYNYLLIIGKITQIKKPETIVSGFLLFINFIKYYLF